MAAKKPKASDKQAVSKKIVTFLKKRYPGSVPKRDHSVLDTMLYGTCLENASVSQADEASSRMDDLFHDLNEIRVSSIAEIEPVFKGMHEPEWKSLRIREILQVVFEKYFAFDFEILRRKTLDLAGKQLNQFRHMTPFVRAYTLQASLGAHLVPVDDRMLNASIFLGLTEPNTKMKDAADSMKSAVRKSDVAQFSHLLRCLASDAPAISLISKEVSKSADSEFDLSTAADRLTQICTRADSRPKSGGHKKKVKKKTPAKSRTSRASRSATKRKSAAAGKKVKKKVAKKKAATTRKKK